MKLCARRAAVASPTGAGSPPGVLLVSASRRVPGRRRTQAPRCSAVEAERETVPLSKEDLVDYLRSGCKPKRLWRIGTEHEKLMLNLSDNTRADYTQIQELLTKLSTRFEWEPMMEGGNIIGCKRDGQSVTLEPGGQFELSGAPLATLHQTCSEVHSHLYQIKRIAKDLDVGFSGIGFDPKWDLQDVPIMPKDRYKLMKAYMPTVGTLGLDMMFRSCTIQVNLDFESEEDMVEKFRIGLALQPIATALFANSPFRNGKPTGYLSWRSHVWTDVDNNRCGTLPFVFEEGFGFERYTEYMLDVPMYFIYRDGTYLDALGTSFRDFLEGKNPALPGETPTLEDWDNHLTTVFPEVRLKRYMEMRGADGGPFKLICALPALWVGLLYDAEAQRQAYELIGDWTQDEMQAMRDEVPRTGLKTPFRNGTIQDVALEVLKICKGGLERRGHDESGFIWRLEQIAETGKCGAVELLDLYNGEWNGSVDPSYKHLLY